MSKTSVLRVQSSEGTKRLDFNSQDTYKTLYQKVAQIFSLPSTDDFTLYKEKNKHLPLGRTQNRTNLKHGDMIYLVAERENLFPTDSNSSSSYGTLDVKSDTPTNGTGYASPKVGSFQTNNMGKLNTINNTDIKEDEVDIQLDKMDGRIPRKRDPQLCHHNVHGKCLHCIPIEPYDEEFLKNRNPPIKHMSFRAYIRKLQSSTASDSVQSDSLPSVSCTDEIALKRHLNLWSGVCFIAGITIGSGRFVSPEGVLKYTESVGLCLIIWVVSGIVALLGALCFAEIGAVIPGSGAELAYMKEGIGSIHERTGDIFAYLFNWTNTLILKPASAAVLVMSFAEYFLSGIMDACGPPETLVKITSVFTLRLWAYDGWNSLNSVTEELKNRKRNLWLSIVLALPYVIILYLLINISYFTVMDKVTLLNSNAVAVTWDQVAIGPVVRALPILISISALGGC
ncbi:unnamed protein product [Rotaria sp. Silwood2]|nr:unnamed protein product [Rotaria sp. Silwood2]